MSVPRHREPATDGHIFVWDVAVRLLHWLLAAVVAFELVYDTGDRLHRVVGYVAVGIVLTRLAWSLVTPGSGRLALLRPSMRATWNYSLALARGMPPRHLAHDPLGLWMVWLLWILVLLLGLTGWMSRLDAFWGDERVHDVHAWLANALLIAVVLHLAGVVVMSWLWRENLSGLMVTGRKRQ